MLTEMSLRNAGSKLIRIVIIASAFRQIFLKEYEAKSNKKVWIKKKSVITNKRNYLVRGDFF